MAGGVGILAGFQIAPCRFVEVRSPHFETVIAVRLPPLVHSSRFVGHYHGDALVLSLVMWMTF